MSYQGAVIQSDEREGRLSVKSASGSAFDFPSGMIITRGPLIVDEHGITIKNGCMIVMGVGREVDALNFENLLMSGQLESL